MTPGVRVVSENPAVPAADDLAISVCAGQAEGVGFEPTETSLPQRFSSRTMPVRSHPVLSGAVQFEQVTDDPAAGPVRSGSGRSGAVRVRSVSDAATGGDPHDPGRESPPENAKAGAATPAKRTANTSSARSVTTTADSSPGLSDVTTLTGHRVRVPDALLYSRRHSPLAKAAYALVDMLTPRGRDGSPYAGHRETMAERLGVSVSGLEKALRALSVEHTEPGLFGVHPVYLTTRRRGYRMTAQRSVMPGVPFAEAPAWSMGDQETGPLVSWTAWQLYVICTRKRLRDRTCRLPARDLAQFLKVRRQSIAGLLDELEAAGLVALSRAPGKETVILPLMVQVSATDREVLAGELAALCGRGTCAPAGASPGPVRVRKPGPARAHRKGRDTASETQLEDTAPPRALAPTGLASAQPVTPAPSSESTEPAVDEATEVAAGGGRSEIAAFRLALAQRNAERHAAELAAAEERERRWAQVAGAA